MMPLCMLLENNHLPMLLYAWGTNRVSVAAISHTSTQGREYMKVTIFRSTFILPKLLGCFNSFIHSCNFPLEFPQLDDATLHAIREQPLAHAFICLRDQQSKCCCNIPHLYTRKRIHESHNFQINFHSPKVIRLF